MLKIIELFAGIGSQTQALKNIGVEHQVVAISDIDKYCDISYRAMHDSEVNNMGDITKIETLPKADLWTYSFPCTNISLAGRLEGMKKGSGTRSGLLWEVERLLLDAKERQRLPKYLLLENVKNLIGKNFKADYDKWLAFLNSLGYKNYWQVLNAKKYGIPQNRERVFCVSMLGDEVPYVFPDPIPLELRLMDMLDEEVPDRYYITKERITAMLSSNYSQRRKSVIFKDITPALCARDWREPKCVVVGNINDGKFAKMTEMHKRVYDKNGLAPTIHTCAGGNTEPKVMIGAMRGRNPKNPSTRKAGESTVQRLEINHKGTANTITTVQKDNLVVCERRYDEGVRYFKDDCCGSLRTIDACGHKRVMVVGENKKSGYDESYIDNLKVRKLMPRECLRLMGWKDEQIDKIVQAKISNTQMYKQAGNGIVIQVLEAIFYQLFILE